MLYLILENLSTAVATQILHVRRKGPFRAATPKPLILLRPASGNLGDESSPAAYNFSRRSIGGLLNKQPLRPAIYSAADSGSPDRGCLRIRAQSFRRAFDCYIDLMLLGKRTASTSSFARYSCICTYAPYGMSRFPMGGRKRGAHVNNNRYFSTISSKCNKKIYGKKQKYQKLQLKFRIETKERNINSPVLRRARFQSLGVGISLEFSNSGFISVPLYCPPVETCNDPILWEIIIDIVELFFYPFPQGLFNENFKTQNEIST